MKFSDIGTNHLKDSTTFKKIQTFSKSNPQKLYTNLDEFNLKYKKISDLYLTDFESLNTSNYSTTRQHMYTSKQSLLNNSNTHIDSKGFTTLMNYNNSMVPAKHINNNSDTTKFHNHKTSLETSPYSINLSHKLNLNDLSTSNTSTLENYLSFTKKNALIAAENDSNQSYNPLKSTLNTK
jgi:hypothetical protein